MYLLLLRMTGRGVDVGRLLRLISRCPSSPLGGSSADGLDKFLEWEGRDKLLYILGVLKKGLKGNIVCGGCCDAFDGSW